MRTRQRSGAFLHTPLEIGVDGFECELFFGLVHF